MGDEEQKSHLLSSGLDGQLIQTWPVCIWQIKPGENVLKECAASLISSAGYEFFIQTLTQLVPLSEYLTDALPYVVIKEPHLIASYYRIKKA